MELDSTPCVRARSGSRNSSCSNSLSIVPRLLSSSIDTSESACSSALRTRRGKPAAASVRGVASFGGVEADMDSIVLPCMLLSTPAAVGPAYGLGRKSVVLGRRVGGRVGLGGGRYIK